MRRRCASIIAVTAAALGIFVPASAQQRVSVRVPADIGEGSLGPRAEAQLATLDRFKAFVYFRFQDRLTGSGIRFRHRIVDDAGKHYKPVHYDHGNGLAAADVDGDDRVDLYFTNQLGGNELWRNLGDGKFESMTATAGVALADRVSVSAAFGDIDNDGDADLFVTTVKMGNVLFENDGRGRFTDITASAGVGAIAHSSGAIFLDYDRDGRLDLFVTNVGQYTTAEVGRGGAFVGIDRAFSGHLEPERAERSTLYRNLGERRFADVSADVGLLDSSWSGDASLVDLNDDLFPDLYVLNMQGDDHYWENRAGERFVDATKSHFPRTPWGTMGIKFFDYDQDGRIDLLLTDMHSDMSEDIGPEREKRKSRMQWSAEQLAGGDDNIFGNALFHNLGDGRFAEVSDELGVENYWPWGVSVDDLNADGWDDVLITSSMNFPFRYGVNSLLINNLGESFLDAEFIVELEPRAGGQVVTPWFDLDCSGGDRQHLQCQGREGALTVLAAVGTRSAVIFDLDGDGDLDIVTNELNGAPQVLISDLGEQQELRYLAVELVGTTSNRDGLGARVRVFSGERTITKYVDGKSGYLSQSSLPLYFGLGAADRVDRVEVRWPSGREQTIAAPAINRLVEMVEPR